MTKLGLEPPEQSRAWEARLVPVRDCQELGGEAPDGCKLTKYRSY